MILEDAIEENIKKEFRWLIAARNEMQRVAARELPQRARADFEKVAERSLRAAQELEHADFEARALIIRVQQLKVIISTNRLGKIREDKVITQMVKIIESHLKGVQQLCLHVYEFSKSRIGTTANSRSDREVLAYHKVAVDSRKRLDEIISMLRTLLRREHSVARRVEEILKKR